MADINPPLSHTLGANGVENPLPLSTIGHTFAPENADAQKAVIKQSKTANQQQPKNDQASGEGALDFWDESAIDPIRWNQRFPYEFRIIEINKSGGVSYYGGPEWLFTLPIPPESMTISMPFAINVSATLGGIIEEHNGTPFKMISLSGTTGVLPKKGSLGTGTSFNQILAGSGIAGGVVNGVVGGVSQTVRAAQDTARLAIGGNFGLINNTVTDSEIGSESSPGEIGKTSGFYQFLLLQSFFERYGKLKKTDLGKNKVLAFANWKDTKDQVYLVTPVSFDLRRLATSPFEYAYSIQLKAWRRVRVGTVPNIGVPDISVSKNPDKMARVLSTLISARRTLEEAKNTLQAVRGDIDRAINFVREGILFSKDVIGFKTTLRDFPESIQKQVGREISAYKNMNKENFDRKTQKDQSNMRQLGGEITQSTPSQKRRALNSAPGANVYQDGAQHGQALDKVNMDSLDLPVSTKKKIEEEKKRVRSLVRSDFEEKRDALVSVIESFSDSVGAGSSIYDTTFDKKAGTVVRSTPTSQDLEILFALNQTIMAFNALSASGDGEPSSRLSTIEYIAGLARGAGIAFREPVSKFAVPFPYGSTLEILSSRYLGDPNRWHEIATLNGLREPYVDEVGFRFKLLTNGNGNEVVIEDVSNVFVGQPVYISSTASFKERRRVIGIRTVTLGQNIVSVDGETDLAKFKVLDNAVLEAFLPDTVNSQMLVYIPSDEIPIQNDFKSRSIPGVDEFDPMIAVGGVDFLLTPANDIVLTDDGDNRLAVGLTNIVQRVRLILNTRQGTLLHHPEYGLPIEVGVSVADVSASELLKMAQTAFSNDPTFSAIRQTSVSIKGGLAQIGISVEVSGVNQTIPVSFEIKQ